MTAGTDALLQLEQLAGVSSTTIDGLGEERTATDSTRCAVLRALGYDVSTPTDASTVLLVEQRRRDSQPVPTVLVAWEGAFASPVRAPEDTAWTISPTDLNDGQSPEPTSGIVENDTIAASGLATGFHRLEIEVGSRSHTALVISAPTRAWGDSLSINRRRWGVMAPTPSLWDRKSESGGTITHLERAAEWAAESGASVIATLPMLAAADGEASPYSPVSRHHWDERILSLKELGGSEIEVATGSDSRRPADESRAVAAAIDALIQADPELAKKAAELPPGTELYCRFRAMQHTHGDDWRTWAAPARTGDLDSTELDPTIVNHHRVVQWAAESQLLGLNDRLAASGMDLYLDLPIGSNPNGFDHWRRQDAFAEGVQVGAPPDDLFVGGQAWGFAPQIPEAARRDDHGDFRASLDAHMRNAGILRLDHVMSLERLYWLVDDARDGVYVYQPLQELLAVVSLMSHRHHCAVVGENLGTVSENIDSALVLHGIAGMHVAQFDPLKSPAAGSIASINTHDLPTLAGWWNGDDIDLARGLGLFDADEAQQQRSQRGAVRTDMAERSNTAAGLGSVPEPVAHQLLERLGHSQASLVLVDVGDLWGERNPYNVPGTVSRTNWVRRTAIPLDEWTDEQRGLLTTLDRARSEGEESGSWPPPGWWFGAQDQHLFNEGSHTRLWHSLGGRLDRVDGVDGVRFSVWAPNAKSVHLIGDFNGWGQPGHPLRAVGMSGVWDTFFPGTPDGTRYKYVIQGATGRIVEKTDPLSFRNETAPATASIITDLSYRWSDDDWLAERAQRNRWDQPISIYEVHLGSWRRVSGEGNRHLSYTEHADALVAHVLAMGFTHVELMPITEHPLYSSWGYQTTGYFAATSRYGEPVELMGLINEFHRAGIGVILDWVPSHFPTDDFALNAFDGTRLYEHADPREGFHPDWKSAIFNYGRHEVRSFLLSSARFWLEAFHVDGLRVDAVASMLYRDYSRGDDWVPNRYGGRENLEAIEFLQQLNHEMYAAHPDTLMIAEESTAWPGVTKATDGGGLGFGFKWDMGWMNDTLEYFSEQPVHRRWHHNKLTFRAMYGFTENYVLPLSHDEVVHGKGSLLAKMPGDDWQQFANLRLLFGWQYTTPGKKLLFMGSELAPRTEWNHDESLPWHLTEFASHEGVLQWVAELNRLHREVPALHKADSEPEGFRWIDADDAERSILSFVRSDGEGDDVVVVLNNTPVPRSDVLAGVPTPGKWEVLVCSDAERFGGAGYEQPSVFTTTTDSHNGFDQSLSLTLPALSITLLRPI